LARARVLPRLLTVLERKILLELTGNLVLILIVTTGVFFLGGMIQFLMRASDLGLDLVLAVLPSLFPSLAAWTIPSSLLLATVMTFGRMAEDNEITALRAGGVNLYHVVLPALFLGTILSGASLLLHAEVIPAAQARQEVGWDLVERFRSVLEAARRNTYVFRGRRLSWHRIDEDGSLIGLTIDRRSYGDHAGDVLTAERARIATDEDETGFLFDLENVTIQQFAEDGTLRASLRSETLPLRFAVQELLGPPLKERAVEMSMARLIYGIERGELEDNERVKLQEELHERLVVSFAPLVLAILGTAVGILVRKGTLVTSFLLAFFVAAVPFYGLLMAGRSLALARTLPPAAAVWPTNVVMGLVGLVLLRKAVRG
jgi:lipopolysaccharide export system permease protein